MFESATVFIVGAGASAEAKLPIGSELTGKIADLLNFSIDLGQRIRGDENIYAALKNLVHTDPQFEQNNFIGSGRAVAEAMQLAPSIDTFLESHASNQEFTILGKLGIVRAIQIEERRCLLAPSDNRSKPFNLSPLAATWYYSLARQLFTGVPVEAPEQAFENVSFIVFNYDRCLQAFLTRALQVYFQLNEHAAAQLLSGVRILHPYGSLGSIFPGTDQVPFAPQNLDLLKAANRIKTFSESTEAEVTKTARSWFDSARTQIYLGFGFHDQNMKLLEPDHVFLSDEVNQFRYDAYATTYGLSNSDEDVVKNQISYSRTGGPYDNSHPWIHTSNGTCAGLFQSYWRSLTK